MFRGSGLLRESDDVSRVSSAATADSEPAGLVAPFDFAQGRLKAGVCPSQNLNEARVSRGRVQLISRQSWRSARPCEQFLPPLRGLSRPCFGTHGLRPLGMLRAGCGLHSFAASRLKLRRGDVGARHFFSSTSQRNALCPIARLWCGPLHSLSRSLCTLRMGSGGRLFGLRDTPGTMLRCAF